MASELLLAGNVAAGIGLTLRGRLRSPVRAGAAHTKPAPRKRARRVFFAFWGLALCALVSACGGTTGSASSAASTAGAAFGAPGGALAGGVAPGGSASTVLARSDPKLGMLLTDPAGKTLYWYAKDTPGTSACVGACLTAWPAFTASTPLTLPSGIPGQLSAITRGDGGTQVAYNGMPLYHFAKDAQPGDATGQGVGGAWFVVPPGTGPAVTPTPGA